MRSFSIALLVFFAMACFGYATPSEQQTATTQVAPIVPIAVSVEDFSPHKTEREIMWKDEWTMHEAKEILASAERLVSMVNDDHAKQREYLVIQIGVISLVVLISTVWTTCAIVKSRNIMRKHENAIKRISCYYKGIEEFKAISKESFFNRKTTDDLSREKKEKKEKIKKAAALDAPFAAAALASIKRDWDDASFLWRQVLRANPENEKAERYLVHALNQSGLDLCELAKHEDDASRKQKLLEEACGKYKKATNIDVGTFNTWGNWGDCLQKLAETFKTDASCRKKLLEEACGKYEKAINRSGKKDKSWNNWGECLEKLAALDPSRRQKLLEDARGKYQEAVALCPNSKVYSDNLNRCMGELDKHEV